MADVKKKKETMLDLEAKKAEKVKKLQNNTNIATPTLARTIEGGEKFAQSVIPSGNKRINPEVEAKNATFYGKLYNEVADTMGLKTVNLMPATGGTGFQINEISAPLLNYNVVQNEFLINLINKIALTIINQKYYENPLKVLKSQALPIGYDSEEIFANPAESIPFSFAGTSAILSNYTPDIKVAYHRMNRMDVYPVTVNQAMMKLAFSSWTAFGELVQYIVRTLYNGDEIDEFMFTKGVMSHAIDNGFTVRQTMPAIVDEVTGKTFLKSLRSISSKMTFASDMWNSYSAIATAAGMTGFTPVKTWTPKNRQVLIITSDALANTQVDVLAAAFNMNLADFTTRLIEIDSFPDSGTAADDFAVNTFALLCDEGFFQIRDNHYELADFRNAATLSTNYFLHRWETFSYSPFANCVSFGTY